MGQVNPIFKKKGQIYEVSFSLVDGGKVASCPVKDLEITVFLGIFSMIMRYHK